MKKVFAIAFLIVACFCGNTKVSAQSILDENPNEGLYKQDGTGYYRPMQYPSIREADVMWRKRIWRTIDFRQKMNQVFYYPTETHYNWTRFIDILVEAWKKDEIKVYPFNAKKDELENEIQYDAWERLYADDSYWDADINDSVREVRWQDFERLNIMEDWYFDKQRCQLMVRILAIGPVKKQGEDRYTQMFWVSYNDTTRELLAKSKFFNRGNAGAPLNYDQIFMLRMFDSYIYKEENPYDRTIISYAQGRDALMESERIKQEIIDFEQNLWEY
ncbi:MAG: gliding motility protein GldN [Bacteroidales bacterium]|nr:gliding motility protein GldN [Bacteroidales bacterium]